MSFDRMQVRRRIATIFLPTLMLAHGEGHGETDTGVPPWSPRPDASMDGAPGTSNIQSAVTFRVVPPGSVGEQAALTVLQTEVLLLPGAPSTRAEIGEWSDRLTQALRRGGFPVGQVRMGEADWNAMQQPGGVPVFTVFPGRVSDISIENGTRVHGERLQRLVNKAMCGNTTFEQDCLLQTSRLERTTQLLQDVPGVAIAQPPQFMPGAEQGDIRLALNLDPQGKPVQGSVVADNKGIPTTGRYRFGFSVAGNNYFGAGESYGLTVTGTNGNMWTGTLNASMPILDNGLRVTGGFTRQQYSINAVTRLTGVANIAQIGVAYPVTRGLDRNVWLSASYLYSRTKTAFDEFSLLAHSTLNAGRISLQANNGDRAQQLRTNIWSGELALTIGNQRNDTPLLDEAANLAGDYAKLAASGSGTYGLNPRGDLFLSVRANAQVPSRNLDPSEKLVVGGADAVRPYRADEGSMDEGVVANFGIYKRMAVGAGHLFQAGLFSDIAFGRVNHSPWPNWELSYIGVPGVRNRRLLAGYGIGLDWLTPIGVTFSASVSKAYGFSSTSWVEPGKKPLQYWLSISWNSN